MCEAKALPPPIEKSEETHRTLYWGLGFHASGQLISDSNRGNFVCSIQAWR